MNKSHNFLILGPNISIQLTFDPWDIKNIPKIQFMGTEAVVAPIRDSYINNLENWDPDYDIAQNILRLLGKYLSTFRYRNYNTHICKKSSKIRGKSGVKYFSIKHDAHRNESKFTKFV